FSTTISEILDRSTGRRDAGRARAELDEIDRAVRVLDEAIKPQDAPRDRVNIAAASDQGSGGASTTAEEPGAPTPDDLVTLSQAASIVHRHKRTLEYYKTKGVLPDPAVEGGGGKPHLYDWKVMRPWLDEHFGVKLPETFLANPRH